MKRIYILILIMGLLTVFTIGYADSNSDPGSQQDPLATKSYVDSKLSQISAGTNNYEVIELKTGEVITLYQGSEAILRTGNSVIVTKTDGVSDLTGGNDLKNNTAVPANHLLLFPRSDGRGIKARSDSIIIVIGKYTKN